MADCDREYICRNLTCRLGNAVGDVNRVISGLCRSQSSYILATECSIASALYHRLTERRTVQDGKFGIGNITGSVLQVGVSTNRSLAVLQVKLTRDKN